MARGGEERLESKPKRLKEAQRISKARYDELSHQLI